MIAVETNPIWAPIRPRPEPLWRSVAEVVEAYQQAERPVRVSRSQRYSLVVTEPLPAAEWRRM